MAENGKSDKLLRPGKASDPVLNRSVQKRLEPVLDKRRGKAGVLTMDPVTAKTKDVGFLSVVAAVNDLLADGGVPREIQTTVLLPEGSGERTLREIEDQIREAAQLYDVKVSGGHTEVTGAVTRPVVVTAASREAKAIETCKIASDNSASEEATQLNRSETTQSRTDQKPAAQTDAALDMKDPEQAPDFIVAAGWIGLEGTMLLATEKEAELLQRFPVRLVETAKAMRVLLPVKEAAAIGRQLGSQMVHASGGGVFGALWKLSEKTGRGLEVYLDQIPIRQETVEITEYFGIHPYELASAGCLLMTTKDAEVLTAQLEDAGVRAAVIGKLREDHQKLVLNGDEIGNLNLPPADSLLLILG